MKGRLPVNHPPPCQQEQQKQQEQLEQLEQVAQLVQHEQQHAHLVQDNPLGLPQMPPKPTPNVVESEPFSKQNVENRLAPEPYDEYQAIAVHFHETEARIHRDMNETAPNVPLYMLTSEEYNSILQTLRTVRQDIHDMRDVLRLTGRPPDEREKGCAPIPDWDDYFCYRLCDKWGQHPHSEPDYYHLRAYGLYSLGTCALVGLRGRQRQKEYLRMALIQSREARRALENILQSTPDDDIHNYWRYSELTCSIHSELVHDSFFSSLLRVGLGALLLIDEILVHESTNKTMAPRALHDELRENMVQALSYFHRSIRASPSSPLFLNVQNEQKCSNRVDVYMTMAHVASSYLRTLHDHQIYSIWVQHTINLFSGALRENSGISHMILQDIALAYRQYAYWIHSHPDRQCMVFPEVTPVFKEMQYAAVAAVVRQAAWSIERLQQDFPAFQIDPNYLSLVQDLNVRDRSEALIRQYRMTLADGMKPNTDDNTQQEEQQQQTSRAVVAQEKSKMLDP
ncbi:hypothetical protein BG004_003788 [Podila humilis]|nr:hypothetical protein BG004_003788 [Podila humilis]